MSDHIEPNLDAYLAGGLTPDERHDLEQHCEACSTCALLLKEGQQVDQLMNDLFAQTRPDAGLEDRSLERLRRKPAKRYGIMYFVLSAAAMIALGLIGAAAQAMVEGSMKPRGNGSMAMVPEQGNSISLSDISFDGLRSDVHDFREKKENEKMTVMDINPSTEFDADIQYLSERLADVSVPGASDPNKSLGFDVAGHKALGDQSYRWYSNKLSSHASNGILTPNLNVPINNRTSGLAKKEPSNGGRQKEAGNPMDVNLYYLGISPTPVSASLPKTHAGAPPDPTVVPPDGSTPGYHSPDAIAKAKDQDEREVEKKLVDMLKNVEVRQRTTTKVSEQKAEEIEKLILGVIKPSEPASKVEQKQPEPDAGRKIIRTGEMEFEIDSFYASVDTINGLLKKVTKGAGFVATSNSDKLPNGKMKGSVVVRMPPQHLDDFLAELRTALGKVGELKSQRIGSADVTKQYTDIESELRAARAVETRLIEIIKTGKGEIKDLVAAERELGTWRTKIEKMEGEIRYYNNQIALSTITITLAEKEIQAAVALVLRERVAMNIEVEEVEKAQESIAAGVKAAKGRIVKNDLNVGDAGQVSAIVHVEVPPESAPLFRELLKKLGVVSKYQADRTQQAVGGSAEKSLELKQRTDDVRFELNLYNSANIKPRETLHFKLGVADVADTYRTIREAVAKMKGQIRKSDLNEKDPMNITAELVFNVAVADRAAIDKLVAAAGLIVSKHTVQAAIHETATERTVGYELNLRNVAAIPPRDIFTVAVASQDVPASYRKLHDAVEQMKGRIHKGQVNEQDKFNVSAEFDFDIASAEKPAMDKLVSEVGVTISRKNEQFPAKDEATDQKVGYRLTLKNVAGSTPREKAMLALRVNDVDARAAHLKELVLASKGRVVFSKSERNKNGETKMVLIFELPHAALDTIVRQIKDGQTPLVYDKELNPQVPDNDLAMAQIALTLIAVPDIVPSEEDGLSSMLRTGLSKAVYIFLWCLVVVISGLAIILPWAIPIWIVVWLVRRNRTAKPVVVETPKVG